MLPKYNVSDNLSYDLGWNGERCLQHHRSSFSEVCSYLKNPVTSRSKESGALAKISTLQIVLVKLASDDKVFYSWRAKNRVHACEPARLVRVCGLELDYIVSQFSDLEMRCWSHYIVEENAHVCALK